MHLAMTPSFLILIFTRPQASQTSEPRFLQVDNSSGGNDQPIKFSITHNSEILIHNIRDFRNDIVAQFH